MVFKDFPPQQESGPNHQYMSLSTAHQALLLVVGMATVFDERGKRILDINSFSIVGWMTGMASIQ